MTPEEIKELATAVAMVKYYNEIIDNAKIKIRELAEEEINKINEGNQLHINRAPDRRAIYSEDYKARDKALKAECKIGEDIKENHKITLTAQPTAIKRAAEARKMTEYNLTDIRQANKTIATEKAEKAAAKAAAKAASKTKKQ